MRQFTAIPGPLVPICVTWTDNFCQLAPRKLPGRNFGRYAAMRANVNAGNHLEANRRIEKVRRGSGIDLAQYGSKKQAVKEISIKAKTMGADNLKQGEMMSRITPRRGKCWSR